MPSINLSITNIVKVNSHKVSTFFYYFLTKVPENKVSFILYLLPIPG